MPEQQSTQTPSTPERDKIGTELAAHVLKQKKYSAVANILEQSIAEETVPNQQKEAIYSLDDEVLRNLNTLISNNSEYNLIFFLAIGYNQFSVQELLALNKAQLKYLNELLKNTTVKRYCFHLNPLFSLKDLLSLKPGLVSKGLDLLKREKSQGLYTAQSTTKWKNNEFECLEQDCPLSLLLALKILSFQQLCNLTLTQIRTFELPSLQDFLKKEIITLDQALSLTDSERDMLFLGGDLWLENRLKDKELSFDEALLILNGKITRLNLLVDKAAKRTRETLLEDLAKEYQLNEEQKKAMQEIPEVWIKLVQRKVITPAVAIKIDSAHHAYLKRLETDEKMTALLLKAETKDEVIALFKKFKSIGSKTPDREVQSQVAKLLKRIHPAKKENVLLNQLLLDFFACKNVSEMQDVFAKLKASLSETGLNTHRHATWDRLIGLNNTHSWQVVWDALRSRAKAQLFSEVDAQQDVAEKLSLLSKAADHALFREPIPNFIFTGSRQRTTLIEINKKYEEIYNAHSKQVKISIDDF